MKKVMNILLCMLLLASCQSAEPDAEKDNIDAANELVYHENLSVEAGFDTFIDLRAATYTQEEFDTLFNDTVNDFKAYNEYFDIYNDYAEANIKTINDNAGMTPVEVSQEIIDMLMLSKEFYDITDGKFDVTMGSILKIWHEYREEGIELNNDGKYGNVPDISELEEAKKHIGWDHVIIDDDNNTVYIDDPEVSLDVGGVAKGYATEECAKHLEEMGVTSALINAGGNNRTINQKLDGSSWKVGIQDPDSDGSIVIVSADGSMSFVTSGDYQRYYIGEGGTVYSHIIDIDTLYPATYFRSVSIITQNSAIADILSTSLFTLSYEDGYALLNKVRELYPEYIFDAIWLSEEPLDGFTKVGSLYVRSTDDESDVIAVKINE